MVPVLGIFSSNRGSIQAIRHRVRARRFLPDHETPFIQSSTYVWRGRRHNVSLVISVLFFLYPAHSTLNLAKQLDLFSRRGRFGETMVIGYECARAKPHPDPYQEGLSRLGLTADVCVAFEDSVNGVISAVDAGLYTIGVGGAPRKKLQDAGAGLCVTDYLDSRLPAAAGFDSTMD